MVAQDRLIEYEGIEVDPFANDCFTEPTAKAQVDLKVDDNLFGARPEKLYPKGYKLLVTESKRHGPEWRKGQPLGLDPTNEEALKIPIGWNPPQQRIRKRGLGGDITDSVWKEWLVGNLEVPLPTNFIEPPKTWSEDSQREVRMASANNELVVQSQQELIRSNQAYRDPYQDIEGAFLQLGLL